MDGDDEGGVPIGSDVGESHCCYHFCFVAFGTRGDVQPLAVLAANLAKRLPKNSVSFCTHEAHEAWLSTPLQRLGVGMHCVRSLPAREWTENKSRATLSPPCDTTLTPRHKRAWHDDASAGDYEQHEQTLSICKQAFAHCAEDHKALIVCNLFALEAWHIGEFLGVHTLIASPCLPPYSIPSAFTSQFKSAFPNLYHRLKHAQSGKEVSWSEVEHWMWPLFTERWGEWRRDHLGLSGCPFLDVRSEKPLPSPTKALFGLSSVMLAQPGYWPSSMRVCGHWLPDDRWLQANAPDDGISMLGLRAFLQEQSSPPLLVTFGSVMSMGLVKLPEAMSTVTAASVQLQLPVIFLTDTRKDVVADISAPTKSYVHNGAVPHDWLLPQCCAIVHHGGCGTTATSLAAGKPQVICPFIWDQFMWAEKMAWLGLAPEPLKQWHLMPEAGQMQDAVAASVKAVRFALSDEVQAAAKRVEQEFASTGGIAEAVLSILEESRACVTVEKSSGLSSAVVAPSVEVVVLPNRMRVYSISHEETLHCYREIFVQHVYTCNGIKLGNSPGVVLDVGANIGLFTLFVNHACHPTPPTIYAFEPLQPTFTVLQRNLKLHNVVNVHPVNAGLWCGAESSEHSLSGGEDTLEFTYYPNMPGNATAIPREKEAQQKGVMKPKFFQGSQRYNCQMRTLSSFIRDNDIRLISLLKVDVEGMEFDVLKGLEEAHWRLVQQVVVEVHDVGDRLHQVQQLLTANGMRVATDQVDYLPLNMHMVNGFQLENC
eukprot:jgi/Chlat1/113/Chrsp1S08789